MKFGKFASYLMAINLVAACSSVDQISTPESLETVDFCETTPSSDDAKQMFEARQDTYREWAEEIGLEDLQASGRAIKPVPLVRVPPAFPPRASACGYEGSCTLVFDIEADGTPTNIHSVCTAAMFEANARRAISRLKFSPFTIDGKPTEFKSIIQTIRFKLDDSYL